MLSLVELAQTHSSIGTQSWLKMQLVRVLTVAHAHKLNQFKLTVCLHAVTWPHVLSAAEMLRQST